MYGHLNGVVQDQNKGSALFPLKQCHSCSQAVSGICFIHLNGDKLQNKIQDKNGALFSNPRQHNCSRNKEICQTVSTPCHTSYKRQNTQVLSMVTLRGSKHIRGLINIEFITWEASEPLIVFNNIMLFAHIFAHILSST